MKIGLSKIAAVIRRDLLEMRSLRRLAVFVPFMLIQAMVMCVSKDPGRTQDVVLIFMFGGLAGVLIGFDGIARERDQHTLDLLLTQGISRLGLFAAKWISLMMLCTLAAGVATAGGMLGALISGKAVAHWDFLAEFGAVTWLLCIYGVLTFVCSVTVRRSKWALITAVGIWIALRPMLIGMLILGPLKNFLGWTQNQVWHIALWMPEFAFRFMLDPTHGIPSDVTLANWIPYATLSIFLIGLSCLGWLIFQIQDEPTF